MSRKYALIIGNTDYIDPGLVQLTAPGKDAEDFARILKDQNICAFDQVNIWLNQLSSTVIEAVDEFFDQRKPDDLLVLYFSGHGVRDEFGSLYLAVRNTIRTRLRSTAIRSDYIREAMDQSRSKRQVLILDCCNSGAFPQGAKAEVGGAMGITRAFQGYGRFVLTASDATQYAWEGDKVIGETQNSLFTHFLVKGLEGEADSDGDGTITVDELYDYAYDQISRITPKQTPTKSASKQEGEIVLRQSISLEHIKAVPLPTALLDSIENPFPDIRLVAVQQLIKLLNGKNRGLARSAREALERVAKEDDSRRVAVLATQALESTQLSLNQATTGEPERAAQAQNDLEVDPMRMDRAVVKNTIPLVTETPRLEAVDLESAKVAPPVPQGSAHPKRGSLPKWAWMAAGISSLLILILCSFLVNNNTSFLSGIFPNKATVTSTPTLNPGSIASAKPTATYTLTFSPSPQPCFQLLSPEKGAELEASQKIDFTWEAMEGAANYLLEIILPNETILSFESEDTSITRYTESIPTAGTYQWQVTAYDVEENILCVAGPFDFSKPQSNPPRPTKNNNGGSQNPGGGATGTVTAFPTP